MNEETQHPLKELLGDIWVPVQVIIGQKRMKIHEGMELKIGDLIAFERYVGESLDVSIAGNLAARGEVVVVNETYGCRLSEVIRLEDSFKEGIDRL